MPSTTLNRNEYRLDESEARLIWDIAERAASRVGSPGRPSADPEIALPEGLRRSLTDFAARGPDQGFFLIRGLPTGTPPATPDRHGAQVLTGDGTWGLLALVADTLGTLVGYQDEKGGALVHEVHPVRGEEQHIENSGSVAFDFHTENVHHPLRPDFLGLLCLRQDHDAVAATRVASVRRAQALLSEEHLAVLRSPRFHSAYPTSFTRGAAGPRPRSGPHPVLFGEAPTLFMRYNSHTTEGPDRAAEEALRSLAGALEEVCEEIVLSPGDLVVVDNHVAAHGRSAFRPRYDGEDRWLRRFYSLRSVPRWAEQMMAAPRVLPRLEKISGVL